MGRFAKFNEFKKSKSLLERAEISERLEVTDLINQMGGFPVEEGLLSDLQTGVSKFLFGSLSKAGMVDDLRKKLLDIEIKYLDQKFDLNDEFDKIEDELGAAKKEGNESIVSALSRQMESKNAEISALEGSHKNNVKRVYELLDKLISKSARLREYWETGRAEDEYKLAQAKYEVLKNRSASSERLAKQRVAMEKAKAEAEKAAEKFKRDNMDAEGKGKSKEGADKSDSGKDSLVNKKPKDIIDRKKELGVDIAGAKADLERILEKAKKTITKGTASSKSLDKLYREALEISVVLDSKISLLKAYREMGKSADEIEKNLANKSRMKDLSKKINTASTAGSSSISLVRKSIQDAFSGKATVEKIDKATSEIETATNL